MGTCSSMRRRMMMSGGAISYTYEDAAYIYNENGGYINTGFMANQDTRIVLDIMYIDRGGATSGFLSVFGAGNRSTDNAFSLLQNATGSKLQPQFYNSYKNSSSAPTSGNRYTLELNKNAYNLGGLGSGTLTAGTFQLTSPLHLFHAAGRAQNNTRYRLYSCQIYDNGTLVRDYVPKMRSDGKYGLLDNVEDKFYLSPNNIDFVGALTE